MSFASGHLKAAGAEKRDGATATGVLFVLANDGRAGAVCEDDAYVRTIERMQQSFDKQVRDLILLLKAGVHIEPAVVNLVSRLDYNNYYQRMYR